MHESERSKPSRWVPFAWMPVFKDELALNRPKPGYHSHKAQRVHLEHQASVSAHSLACGLVRARFKFATLGISGMERRAHCSVLASPLACSRQRSLCAAGHFAPVTKYLSCNYSILLTYYYLITTILLHHYFSITTTLLLFHYYSP